MIWKISEDLAKVILGNLGKFETNIPQTILVIALLFLFWFYQIKKPPRFNKEKINEIIESAGLEQVSKNKDPSIEVCIPFEKNITIYFHTQVFLN